MPGQVWVLHFRSCWVVLEALFSENLQLNPHNFRPAASPAYMFGSIILLFPSQ
jgi:hypothetical protein